MADTKLRPVADVGQNVRCEPAHVVVARLNAAKQVHEGREAQAAARAARDVAGVVVTVDDVTGQPEIKTR